jgi:2,4-dienoyl-CoA reductase-like NADH-dependent reductase (Old Yellow Enzyme family)
MLFLHSSAFVEINNFSLTMNITSTSDSYGTNPSSRVWKEIKVGDMILKHRIVMAPLTRYRAPNHLVNDMHVTYYSQRASDGGLLISEATFISKKAGGFYYSPGIYTAEHIERWKKVTKAVHAKGGKIYCQLWAIGRANKGEENDVEIISASNIPFEGGKIPRALSLDEIEEIIKSYGHAARCAIEAGFDGCEVHGAHGYLPDQFLQKTSNCRTDKYGGSLENRSRFMLEALAEVVNAIGVEKTAIRISPFSVFQGMGKEPIFETFGYICQQIKERFHGLSYISITDPRLRGQAGSGDNDADVYTVLLSDTLQTILEQ